MTRKNESHWEQLKQDVCSCVTNGHFDAVAIAGYQNGLRPEISAFRSLTETSAEPLFLVASLTKPILAMLVVQLVEEGALQLNRRISDWLPEWNRGEKRRITVRQLLCHASGLPDQLPENQELRDRAAPLEEFYERLHEVPLLYPPGSGSQYQSMGYLTLEFLLRRITGQKLPQLMQERIFQPLGMQDSFLGAEGIQEAETLLSRVHSVQLPADQDGHSGNWNSAYWQGLGAPWGGLLSTAADIMKFCQEMLAISRGEGTLVTRAGLLESVSNQLQWIEGIPERERTYRGWGLGWRLNWKAHPETFGDLLPAETIGHWGATGCLMWLDLAAQSACVILTNQPSQTSRMEIVRLSNRTHAALHSS